MDGEGTDSLLHNVTDPPSTGGTHDPARRARRWTVPALTLFLAAISTLAAAFFFWSWDLAERASSPEKVADGSFLAWQFRVALDQAVLLVVAASGALGSVIHGIMSFTTYVGNGQFCNRWVPWYLLRLFLGVAVGLLIYVVARAGLLTAGTAGSTPNLYGAAAIGGMAGVFAKQAADKLHELFDVALRTGKGYGDSQRLDSTTNHPRKDKD